MHPQPKLDVDTYHEAVRRYNKSFKEFCKLGDRKQVVEYRMAKLQSQLEEHKTEREQGCGISQRPSMPSMRRQSCIRLVSKKPEIRQAEKAKRMLQETLQAMSVARVRDVPMAEQSEASSLESETQVAADSFAIAQAAEAFA